MLQISVIGGGLGGLAFAQAMRAIGGYQCVVYERDKSPKHRSQGYQIGLNQQGIEALHKLKMPGFNDLISVNPLFGFMMTDSKLDPLVRFVVQDTAENTKSSLVNRWKLRDMLSSGLDIRWDKKFVSYEEKNDCVIAHFDDGTTATSALLVGADGVHSKVREQYRPDLVPEKTGITSIAGFFPTSLDSHNDLPTLKDVIQTNLGRALLPETNTLLFMKFMALDDQENILWSLSFNTDECKQKFGDLPVDNVATMRDNLVKRVQDMGCSPEISKVIAMTPLDNWLVPTETLTMKPMKDAHIRPSSLPPTKHRVVLLGDAAHAMTTHAGLGANTAFQDALHLSEHILGDKKSDLYTQKWPKTHATYEKFMWVLGSNAVKVSFENTQRIHKPNNESGIKLLRMMGYGVKAWNYIRKGKFGF